jgi:hypothetical protein
VNRRNITPGVKITIATFFVVKFKVFYEIMVEGQQVMKITNPPNFG